MELSVAYIEMMTTVGAMTVVTTIRQWYFLWLVRIHPGLVSQGGGWNNFPDSHPFAAFVARRHWSHGPEHCNNGPVFSFYDGFPLIPQRAPISNQAQTMSLCLCMACMHSSSTKNFTANTPR